MGPLLEKVKSITLVGIIGKYLKLLSVNVTWPGAELKRCDSSNSSHKALRLAGSNLLKSSAFDKGLFTMHGANRLKGLLLLMSGVLKSVI